MGRWWIPPGTYKIRKERPRRILAEHSERTFPQLGLESSTTCSFLRTGLLDFEQSSIHKTGFSFTQIWIWIPTLPLPLWSWISCLLIQAPVSSSVKLRNKICLQNLMWKLHEMIYARHLAQNLTHIKFGYVISKNGCNQCYLLYFELHYLSCMLSFWVILSFVAPKTLGKDLYIWQMLSHYMWVNEPQLQRKFKYKT